MKTNQILVRNMGNFDVSQRTQDGMFNATTLLKQWNTSTKMKKEVSKYFENPATKEFVNTIVVKEFANKPNSLEITDTQKTAIADNKQLNNVYVKTRGGIKGGGATWMHPLLFIDFAMWINPTFKYDVLKFVYDELIKFRNDAGDAYIEMSRSVAKIVPKQDLAVSIPKIAQAINWCVFGKHEKEIRNRQGEAPMKELVALEKEVTLLINVGHIKTLDSLMDYLRKKYRDKYQPAIFS